MAQTLFTSRNTSAGSFTERPARQLRGVLALNATTSLLVGIVALAAAGWVSDELGIGSTNWVRVGGAFLILFGADVGLVAYRSGAKLRIAALLISLVDLAWVVGTVVVLAAVDLTTAGRVVAVVLGIGVLDFALLQLWFRARSRA